MGDRAAGFGASASGLPPGLVVPGLRVLVIGGTGAFGRRLISGLIATTEHDVVIGARDLSFLS